MDPCPLRSASFDRLVAVERVSSQERRKSVERTNSLERKNSVDRRSSLNRKKSIDTKEKAAEKRGLHTGDGSMEGEERRQLNIDPNGQEHMVVRYQREDSKRGRKRPSLGGVEEEEEEAVEVKRQRSNSHSPAEFKFPLLSLPNELKTHVFSLLSVRDRLNARVNKNLHGIEASSKFYAKYAYITDKEEFDPVHDAYFYEENCTVLFLSEDSHSREAIQKLLTNTTIECLTIGFSNDKEWHGDFVDDSMLFELANKCERLILDGMYGITAEGLYRVYESMLDGSTKLNSIIITGSREQKRSFLAKILTIRDGQFFSSRDIEVYTRTDNCVYVYEGMMDCFVPDAIPEELDDDDVDDEEEEEEDDDDFSEIVIKLHATQEELEKEKSRAHPRKDKVEVHVE